MHDLLMEADANRATTDSAIFKNCISQLQDLAFRAENVLETYAVEVLSKKQGRSLKKKLQRFICILCECYHVHEVGNEVNNIRSSLANLTDSLKSIPRGEARPSDQEHRPLSRIRYAHEVEQHFVGMEKDIDSVVSMVKDDSPNAPSLISICGMGGLGKTTLARKIYNHKDIQEHFSAFAWVCVTQEFQAEIILKEILVKIGGNKPDQMGLPALVERLHDVLMQKKFFIVIDDIWKDEDWRILRPAFPKKCKIVLTTREKKVASDECHLYNLNFLSEDEGWELLRKIAQVSESKSTSLESIGRKMVRQCGRLPLAISVIGGILRQKQQILTEWEDVSCNMDTYLRNGEGLGSYEKVNLVLDLSFNVLPYYLKPCFLYLTCFAEDENIDTEELYLLWMAEGLIPSEGKGNNETLRDVAQRYLNELALRCLVQVKKSYFNIPHKKFESCRLHDLMRELCSSKAEQEKFIKRVDVSKQQQGIPSAISSSLHRLAICVSDGDVATTLSKVFMEDLKHLRSFLVLRKNIFARRRKFENGVDFEDFKHLRILVFNGVAFEDGNLLSTIGKLIHLKYLSLNKCVVKELPPHVWYLPYLHTLDLRAYGSILKLPNLIWKMKRLRHLFLPEKGFEVIGGDKLKLDGLNELETLEGVDSRCVCIADVINLTNLRTVSVVIRGDMDSLSKIVDHMSSNGCQWRETDLDVRFCDLRYVLNKMLMSPSLIRLGIVYCEIGCSLSSYEQGMCPNLAEIEISIFDIEGDVMGVMGKFPMLQQLLLLGEVSNAEKIEMRFGVDSFPELKNLRLGLMNLYKWEVEMGAMPKLLSLFIDGCKNLEKLPDGLKFISTLQEIKLDDMPQEFKDRYKREGQDYANFSHISLSI